MSRRRFYITTAIPHVNGDPHVGHALEFVQADARHRRQRGGHARFLRGTDDNALKNVEAAEAAGLPVREFVNAKAQRFADLCGSAAALLRRLHSHERRPASSHRRRAALARLRGCG